MICNTVEPLNNGHIHSAGCVKFVLSMDVQFGTPQYNDHYGTRVFGILKSLVYCFSHEQHALRFRSYNDDS